MSVDKNIALRCTSERFLLVFVIDDPDLITMSFLCLFGEVVYKSLSERLSVLVRQFFAGCHMSNVGKTCPAMEKSPFNNQCSRTHHLAVFFRNKDGLIWICFHLGNHLCPPCACEYSNRHQCFKCLKQAFSPIKPFHWSDLHVRSQIEWMRIVELTTVYLCARESQSIRIT